jgi:hypothetical protein
VRERAVARERVRETASSPVIPQVPSPPPQSLSMSEEAGRNPPGGARAAPRFPERFGNGCPARAGTGRTEGGKRRPADPPGAPGRPGRRRPTSRQASPRVHFSVAEPAPRPVRRPRASREASRSLPRVPPMFREPGGRDRAGLRAGYPAASPGVSPCCPPHRAGLADEIPGERGQAGNFAGRTGRTPRKRRTPRRRRPCGPCLPAPSPPPGTAEREASRRCFRALRKAFRRPPEPSGT